MISKLPPWILLGALLLAFIAGYVNVIGFLGFEHEAVTHLTGTTSMMASAASAGDGGLALHYGTIIGAFLCGCILSGYIIQDSVLRLGHRYGIALCIEGILLAAAIPLLQRGNAWGMYLASGACGLQNAMASTYSGAVVRTTHLSGMFTDLGIAIGHALRGISVDPRRIKICGTIVAGFFAGGFLGAKLYVVRGYAALMLPAGLCLAAAGLYWIGMPRSLVRDCD